MNKTLKLICLALLVTAVIGEEFSRALKVENAKKKKGKGDGKSGTGVSCDAFTAIKIVDTQGSCEGEAVPDCKALATSQSTIRKAYVSWWKKDGSGECQIVRLQRAAKTVAEATATAFAASLVKVKCEDKVLACGASSIDGKSFAVSFARAIAQAAVDSGGSGADAFCTADVEAISGAIAEAASSAHSQACVKDTDVQAHFQYAMVNQITNVIATAFVNAFAWTCTDKPGFAGAATKCVCKCGPATEGEGGEESSEKEKISKETAQQNACENEGKCCDPDMTDRFCKPTEDSMYWRRVSEPGETAEFRSWRMPDGNICYCYTEIPFFPTV